MGIKRKSILIRVDHWIHKELKARAIYMRLSTNDFITRILEEHINKNGKKMVNN